MPKKWNSDASPAEKLLSLYAMLLFTGREASLSDLSRDLNCSKQVVLRLIDKLEASPFGKLMRVKRGREAVYHLDRPKLPKISLNAEGLQQLALCRDFILHLLPEAMRKQVDATLQQASAYLPAGENSGMDTVFAQSMFKGRINYTPFQDMLQTLMQAIRERKICAVRYQSTSSTESREFEYAPMRLIAFHETIYCNGWVMEGRRAKYEKPTPLALHRLRGVTPTARSGKHLPEPPAEHGENFGVMDMELFTAKIRFSPKAAIYVAEREWSENQKIVRHRDCGITLTLQARSPVELTAWVLGFGDAAEALSPKWLRESMAEQAAALAALYGTGAVAEPRA
ncbi:MAG: WYL domain-containing protein [Desulfovibrio sp.]|jgi:predicted DNA-binding transcriptional regulator YafY|nr:WYL domain-containing protein [Desulfovibrio sp.]